MKLLEQEIVIYMEIKDKTKMHLSLLTTSIVNWQNQMADFENVWNLDISIPGLVFSQTQCESCFWPTFVDPDQVESWALEPYIASRKILSFHTILYPIIIIINEQSQTADF